MRSLMVLPAFLFLAAAAPTSPPIEPLLERHVAALGGIRAIESIGSIVELGWYSEGDLRIATYAAQRRPFYRVIGDPRDPLGEIHEGYDGSAWEYYPDPGIVLRTVGDAASAARHAADFDDPLVQAEARGITLTPGAPAVLLGASELVVHATLPDGFSEDVFVNPTTWMIDAERRTVPMHAFGKRYSTIDALADYHRDGGVMRAHTFKEIDEDTGEILTQSTVTSVQVNPNLPVAMFLPPQWNRTPLQTMIQRIYDERDEARSVLDTYRNFSALVDIRADATGDAIDFVGYQCLKMGHPDTAVALLSQNVADHPHSAPAHFGLGRAYEASGHIEDARSQYLAATALDPGYKRAKDALDSLRTQ
jgi:tetratricopeptide (TPR) repeat protein